MCKTIVSQTIFLYSINDGRKFWNIVRKNRKANNDPGSDIALSSLVEYYSNKNIIFSMGTVKSNTILNAEQFVSKRQQERLHVKHTAKLTGTRVSKYIHNLKRINLHQPLMA